MATTIKDIARLSGYSIGTVSRVINNHPDVSDTARRRIEEIIAQQHFEPNSNAKQLKQQKSTAITIIVKGYENVFFESILERVQAIMRDSGEEVAVSFLDEYANEVQSAIQLCASRHPKGFLFLGGNLEFFKKDFAKVDVPSVLLTNTAEEMKFSNLSSYTTDDRAASCEAINYLIDHGHKQIGIIGGSSSRIGSQIGYRRMLGCKDAFESHHMPFDVTKQYEPSRFNLAGGYESTKKLLKKNPDITAIFAIGDAIAMGAMRAIADLGMSIPNDISIIGYDGIDAVNYTNPRLATIRQDVDALARKGVEDLLLRINYSHPVVNEIVPFTIVDGESVADIREK